jgi:two-component system sensor histidine kinase YesM
LDPCPSHRAFRRSDPGRSWDIDEDAKTCGVPLLLVQPLAENAVNHGVRRKEGGSGTVSISARRRGDVVLLRVSDDGPGWYEGKGGTGFGLKSVRRRLQLVYGNRAQLHIVKGEGVTVEITLPAQEPTCVQEYSR